MNKITIVALVMVFISCGGNKKSDKNSNQNKEQSPKTILSEHKVAVVLDTTSETVKNYKSFLTEMLKKPVNFNQHYVLDYPGAGTGTQIVLVLDKSSGKAFVGPTQDWVFLDSKEIERLDKIKKFDINSNEIKVVQDRGKLVSYIFDGQTFKKKQGNK